MPIVNSVTQNNIFKNDQISKQKANIKVCIFKEYFEVENLNLNNVWISRDSNFDSLANYNILCKSCYNEVKNLNLFNIQFNRENISYVNFEQHNIKFYNWCDV